MWDYEIANSLGAFPPAGRDQGAATIRRSSDALRRSVGPQRARQRPRDTHVRHERAGGRHRVGDARGPGAARSGRDRVRAGDDEEPAASAIGDTVKVGSKPARTATVVGEALMPATSHTEYDQSAWMTLPGLKASLPPVADRGADDLWDFVFVRWKPGADVDAAQKRLQAFTADCACGGFVPELPGAVADLGRLRSLPFALGIFFALLAIATVAHALVTTVRRWRRDLAVLRSIGFTRAVSRAVAIAWQSTLLATAGVVVGVPLGIVSRAVRLALVGRQLPVRLLRRRSRCSSCCSSCRSRSWSPTRSPPVRRATAARIRPAEVLRAE